MRAAIVIMVIIAHVALLTHFTLPLPRFARAIRACRRRLGLGSRLRPVNYRISLIHWNQQRRLQSDDRGGNEYLPLSV
jgi:hypothetical protein